MDIADFKNFQPPCEPVKPLVYVIATDEVISGYESKYRSGEKQFNQYKQLNDKASLERCCSPELIKLYQTRDCKNLEKYKPSKLEINAAKGKLQEIKNLPTSALMKTAKKVREMHKNSAVQMIIDEQKKFDDLINPLWKKDLDEMRNPAWKKQLDEMIAVQTLHQDQITPELINTAETALKALGDHSALKEKIASIKPYQSEIDSILSRGIDAQVARAMYGTHSELLEQFRNLKPPKKTKKNKKYWKKKAKQIGEEKTRELEKKDKQHAKKLEELQQMHSEKETALKEENRKLLLAMVNGTGRNIPKTEPNWEAGRPTDTEPASFITFALETYWHSKNHDRQKKEKIPDVLELRRWLSHNRNDNFEIKIVDGYIIKINTDGYHIDNTATPIKTVKSKSFTKSFDTVLSKITENMPN